MTITFIRHFKTKGNLEKKYIGRTDESLIEQDLSHLLNLYPKTDIVFSSPLKRCIETSQLIYKDSNIKIVENFKEIDFGDFEGKTYEDLKSNKAYISFIESNGLSDIPNGESINSFKNRCCEGFIKIVEDLYKTNEKQAIVVCHGGTIMSILERFNPHGQDFYSYMVKNGEGFIAEFDYDNKIFTKIDRLGESL